MISLERLSEKPVMFMTSLVRMQSLGGMNNNKNEYKKKLSY